VLRSATYPDPEADQGQHHFAYRLYPHAELKGNADIAKQAYTFNDPLIAVRSGETGAAALSSLVSTTAPNVVIETVKQAEDGNGIIVRFYECNRQRGWVTLRTGFPVQSAYLTNLLEDKQSTVAVNGQELKLYVKPFQITTLRLIPA
jgi:alpha-mannosidase